MNLVIFFQSLVIVFLPFYVFRGIIQIPLINFYIPTTFLEILFLFSLCISAFQFYKDGLPFVKLKTKFDIVIFCFLLNSLLSVFFSPDIYGGLGIFRAYFLEPIIFFYILIYQLRKRSGNFVINSLIISGLILSILGIVQKVTGQFIFAPQEFEQNRVSALYNSANALALYLGPISMLCLSQSISNVKKVRFVYLFLFLVMLGVIFLTRSRGGMIAEAISLIVFMYGNLTFKENIYLKKLWYLVPSVLFLLIISFFIQVYRVYSAYPLQIAVEEVKGDTLHIRYLMWISTFQLLQDNPVFGSGLNGFKTVYENVYKPSAFSEDFQYPHNLFLTFWVETGFVGLVIFMILIYKIFKLLLVNLEKSKDIKLGIGIICMLVYWIIHGVVDVPYFKNDLSMEFWIIIALIVVWSEKKELFKAYK